MKPPFVRSENNYDMNKASDESGLKCLDPTRTKQSDAEAADINFIVKRFNLTGELPTNVRMPQYGDFTGISDYHSAMNAIRQADEAFGMMPAELRARFDNDPEKFVNFVANPANRAEAEKMGLVAPTKPEKLLNPQNRPDLTLDQGDDTAPPGTPKKGDTKKGVT